MVTKTEYLLPPQEWIQECRYPSVTVFTNEGLLKGYVERGNAIDECNIYMRELQEWRDRHTE